MKFGLLLIMFALASENQENKVESAKYEENNTENIAENLILVKIEVDDYTKERKKTSNYFGVSYNEPQAKWLAQRWSKKKKKIICNGTYKNEETAAHASDTLARKLMENDEQNHKLNFPDDNTEVISEKKSSKYFGVSYNESYKAWVAQKWSKTKNKTFSNGSYKDEETAARASDTLARKLMENGEKNHKLNFPYDHTEVLPEKKTSSSAYIGVFYDPLSAKWRVKRSSKNEGKNFYNGYYKDEEEAAHASDTLARKLMENGAKRYKLNFPDDHTEVLRVKKPETSKYFGVYYSKSKERWCAQIWSKTENKPVSNGAYKYEEAAAHASDTLARILMKNGEQNLKLNFPDDHSKVENQKNKRKRSEQKDMDSQNK